MEAKDFLISVIIPVYNGEAFLAEAVGSILEQHYDPLEIIVIDDGSTDRTRQVAADLQGNIRYFYQPNRGLPVSRNKGVQMARGNVICFLDVDDLWTKNKLALQLTHLKQNPSVLIVLGHTQLMRWTGNKEGKQEFVLWGKPVLAMSMGSALFKRQVFDQVGLFDETQRYCDDLDWFMRAREMRISILVHPEVTLFYRRHANNMTNEAELGKQGLVMMIKKSLNRRARQNELPVSLSKLAQAHKVTPDEPET
jgi:glycosyltransferase involved in cell wall biosynthesis